MNRTIIVYVDLQALRYEDAHSFTYNDTLYGPTSHLREKTALLLSDIKRKIHVLRSNGCDFSQLIRSNGACGIIMSPDFTDVPVIELLILQEVLAGIIVKMN